MTHAYSTVLSPKVDDSVPVGRALVLESPHVSEGPGRIANAPVPSVFRDDRGSIHRLKVGNKRINLSYSNKGVMRSGYIHDLEKNIFVVSGEVEIWILRGSGTEKVLLREMDSFRLKPYFPHVLHFPTSDAVIAEWWEPTPTGDLRCWFYHPYRRIVDVQNSLVSRSTGRHSLLVPQDVDQMREDISSRWSFFGTIVPWATGVAIGAVVGAMLATRRR